MAAISEEQYDISLEKFNPINYKKDNSFFIIITKLKVLKNFSPEDLINNYDFINLIECKIHNLVQDINHNIMKMNRIQI